MATTYLSPLGNEQQSDANGAPLSGGKIQTYAAGTTTPLATYQDNAGSVAQANPIVLNTSGMPANPIWLPAGQAVKMVFTDANGVSSRPAVDNIVGINDPSGISIDQWVIYTGAPSFISATSFSVAGDQRNTFQIGRRVRTANSGGTVYGTITNVAFSTVTTVTVVNDAGVLDAGLSQVSYGLISQTSSALPRGPAFSAYQSVAQSLVQNTETKLLFQTEEYDYGNAYDAVTNSRFLPLVAGLYQVSGGFGVATTAANLHLAILKNGVAYKSLQFSPSAAASGIYGSATVSLNGSTDYIELSGFQSAATQNSSATATSTYFQAALVRLA